MRVEVSLETAEARIRTWEPLRDETLNLAPFPSLATAARPRSPPGVEKDSLRFGLDEGSEESVSRRRQSAGSPVGKVHGAAGNPGSDGVPTASVRYGNAPPGHPHVPAGRVRRGVPDRRRAQGDHRDGNVRGCGPNPRSRAVLWPETR